MQLYVEGNLEPNKYYRLFVTDTANKPAAIPEGTILLVTDDEADLDDLKTDIMNTVDTKLTMYSTSAVEWDTTPTQNSTKPVTSGGIYTALHNIDLSQYYTKTEIDSMLRNYLQASISGSTLNITRVN